MLNQCILVGRVKCINDDASTITLLIKRNYKEPGDEVYLEDEIKIDLSDNLKNTAMQYLNVNATVGVKARIAKSVAIVENTQINCLAIVAEKLTFINSNQKK